MMPNANADCSMSDLYYGVHTVREWLVYVWGEDRTSLFYGIESVFPSLGL
jgi:hypothetical protein